MAFVEAYSTRTRVLEQESNWSCREVPFVCVMSPAEGLMSAPLNTISVGYEKLD
jgi:hypothetical protein